MADDARELPDAVTALVARSPVVLDMSADVRRALYAAFAVAAQALGVDVDAAAACLAATRLPAAAAATVATLARAAALCHYLQVDDGAVCAELARRVADAARGDAACAELAVALRDVAHAAVVALWTRVAVGVVESSFLCPSASATVLAELGAAMCDSDGGAAARSATAAHATLLIHCSTAHWLCFDEHAAKVVAAAGRAALSGARSAHPFLGDTVRVTTNLLVHLSAGQQQLRVAVWRGLLQAVALAIETDAMHAIRTFECVVLGRGTGAWEAWEPLEAALAQEPAARVVLAAAFEQPWQPRMWPSLMRCRSAVPFMLAAAAAAATQPAPDRVTMARAMARCSRSELCDALPGLLGPAADLPTSPMLAELLSVLAVMATGVSHDTRCFALDVAAHLLRHAPPEVGQQEQGVALEAGLDFVPEVAAQWSAGVEARVAALASCVSAADAHAFRRYGGALENAAVAARGVAPAAEAALRAAALRVAARGLDEVLAAAAAVVIRAAVDGEWRVLQTAFGCDNDGARTALFGAAEESRMVIGGRLVAGAATVGVHRFSRWRAHPLVLDVRWRTHLDGLPASPADADAALAARVRASPCALTVDGRRFDTRLAAYADVHAARAAVEDEPLLSADDWRLVP
jgi:hypothetical protein